MESMSPGLIHGKTACEKASRGTAGEETPKNLSEPAISRRANVANQEEWFGQIPIPLVPRRGIGDTTRLARRSMGTISRCQPQPSHSAIWRDLPASWRVRNHNLPRFIGRGNVSPAGVPAGHMKCGTLGDSLVRSFVTRLRIWINWLCRSRQNRLQGDGSLWQESPLVCTRYLRLHNTWVAQAIRSQAQRSAYFCDFGGRDNTLFTGPNTAQWEESRLLKQIDTNCEYRHVFWCSLGGGIEPCAWQFLPPPLAGYR